MPPWGCPTCGKPDNFHKHKWCDNINCRAPRPPPPPPLGNPASWPPLGPYGRPKPKKKAKKPSHKKDTERPPAEAATAEGETQPAGSSEKTEITSTVLQELNNLLQQCKSHLPSSDPITGALQKRLEDARAQKQASQRPGLRLRNAEGKLDNKQRHHTTLETRLAEQKAAINKTEAELAKTAGEVEHLQQEVTTIKAQLAAEANLPETGAPKEISQIIDLQAQLPTEIHDEIAGPLALIFKCLNEFKAKQAVAASQAQAQAQPQTQAGSYDADMEIIYAAGPEACKRAGEILATGDREAFKKFRTEQRQVRRAAPYPGSGPPAAATESKEGK